MSQSAENKHPKYPVAATPLQQGMIFHNLKEPDSGVDVEQIVVRSTQLLDRWRLQSSFTALVKNNEILNAYFDWLSTDVPSMHIGESVVVEVEECIVGLHKFERALQEFVSQDRKTGFDLAAPPLMRLTLFQCDNLSVLVWTFHHLLLDGRSFAPLLDELFSYYKDPEFISGKTAEFGDYASWLNERSFAVDLEFWRSSLHGLSAPCVFPTLGGTSGKTNWGCIAADLNQEMFRGFEAAGGVSLNILIQAAWGVLLKAYTGESDVVFGATYTTRHCEFPEAQTIMGLMINTLPVRIRHSADDTPHSLMQDLAAHAKTVRPHVLTPLHLVQQQTELSHGLTLFDTAVVFDRATLHDTMVRIRPDLSHLSCEYTGQTNFPLTLVAYGGDSLSLRLEFDNRRIDDGHAVVILDCLQVLMQRFLENPRQKITEISLLTETARRKRLAGDSQIVTYQQCTLIDTFANTSARFPDKIALRFENQTLSYAQLDDLSNKVATSLFNAGVQLEDRVGLCMQRNNNLVVGLLGIVKAGAAYLPIDPDYPDSRINYILDDAGATQIVTDAANVTRLAPFERGCNVIENILSDELPKPFESVKVAPQNLAYVIYTSGSTGQPKGVAVTHHNVGRLMSACQSVYQFNEMDKWTLFHSIAFDWTVFEIWGALSHGGELNIVPYWITRSPNDFYQLLSANQITILCQTPSAFLTLQDVDEELHNQFSLALRYVVFGGEALEPASLKPWISRHSDLVPALVNMYGITETTVHVTHRNITRVEIETNVGSVIGEPLPDLGVFLLNKYLQPVPCGVVAEIFVAGDGVARGYLNRAELTAEHFCKDLLPEFAQQTLYRSGDLARYLPDGDIVYCGRADTQVKVRGFRIELGEIENVMTSISGVKQSVVVTQIGPGGHANLVGYYVSHTVAVDTLTSTMSKLLPAHMVPSQLMKLEKLPLTVNGKIDRKSLPTPDYEMDLATYKPPQSDVEKAMVKVWEQVLGQENIGVNDNFFERGGDSILSIKLISLARKAGLVLNAREIYHSPTIAGLCEVAESNSVRGGVIQSWAVGDTIPMQPIQQWYFQNVGASDTWNQSFCFLLGRKFDLVSISAAVNSVCQRHPMLFSHFKQGPNGWQQNIAAPKQIPLMELNVSGDYGSNAKSRDAAIVEVNRAVALATGVNVAAAVISYANGQQELCLAIHHLVVDGVSWSIIVHQIDDELVALEKPLEIVAPEYGFALWSTERAANKAQFNNEVFYWQHQAVHPVPFDNTTPRVKHSSHHQESGNLRDLHWPATTHLPTQDIVVAAFASAVASMGGESHLRIDLESHGRSHEVSHVDLSDAVGWFTSLYPITLQVAEDDIQLLENVHKSLLAVPGLGIGHGFLQASGALQNFTYAEHVFNFMGGFSGLFRDCQALEMSAPFYALWRGSQAHHSHPAEWLVAISEKAIHIDTFFDARRISKDTVIEICQRFLERLARLNNVVTTNDLNAEKLLVSLGSWQQARDSGDDVQRILPPTPIQQLYLVSARSGGDIATEQWHLQFKGKLDKAALEAAWRYTLNAHSGLRTSFQPAGSGTTVQLFHENAKLQWQEVELAADEELATVLQSDSQLGLDITSGPMHRLTLVQVSKTESYLVWTHHHLQIDGWSWPLILKQVHARYRQISTGEPLDEHRSDYAEYVQWIYQTRAKIDVAFWRQYLAEVEIQGLVPDEGFTSLGSDSSELVLSTTLSAELENKALRVGVTLSSLFHAAWALTLGRLLNRDKICIGSTFSGRPVGDWDFSETVGPFVSNLPVRVNLHTNDTDLVLQQVHETMLGLQEHQYHSLSEIQLAGKVPWAIPLFESLLVFQNYQIDEATLYMGKSVQISQIHAPIQTNFPLTIVINPGNKVRVKFIYDTARISRSFIDTGSSELRNLLESLAMSRELDISDISPYSVADPREHVICKGEPPTNDLEKKILLVWRDLFGNNQIGVTDNFFDLGGRSIMVPVLMERIHSQLGLVSSIASLYHEPTISGLVKNMESNESGKALNQEKLQSRSSQAKMQRRKLRTKHNKRIDRA